MPKDGYTAEGGASRITKWCLGSQIGVPDLSALTNSGVAGCAIL